MKDVPGHQAVEKYVMLYMLQSCIMGNIGSGVSGAWHELQQVKLDRSDKTAGF